MPSRFAVLQRFRTRLGILAFLLLNILGFSSVQAQSPQPLRLVSLSPGGVRISVTESSGMLDFVVDNPTTIDRQARLVAFYETDPDVHYGKDFWIPARSRYSGSMLFGPAPKAKTTLGREIQYLLYDITGGTEHLLLPTRKEDQIRRSRSLLYHRREPSTLLFLDEYIEPEFRPGVLPQPESREQEAIQFVQLLRTNQGLSPNLSRVYGRKLPVIPEAFAGIDHIVLASSRIANDPLGMRALRHWLRQGGSLWVMLDRTDPELLAPLLEDSLDFQVLNRETLDQFTIASYPSSALSGGPVTQKHDQPIDFVRVVLPKDERAPLTVDGWPMVFVRNVGYGQVVFSTLGPRATYRPRTPADDAVIVGRGPNAGVSDEVVKHLPIPNEVLRAMIRYLRNPLGEKPFSDQSFAKVLGSQIGYEVASLNTVAALLGLFLLAELAMGWWLRRLGKPMLLLWASPLIALATGAIFLLLGENSRSAAPTVAVGEVVNAVGNREEVTVRGLIAVFRPEAGPLVGSTEGGGLLELDRKGLEGQIGRRIMTDMDTWHWANLSTPAGVRLSTFQFVAPTPEPIEAVARFTSSGLEGSVRSGPFKNLSDAVFCGPGDRRSTARLGSNGSVEVSASEMLNPNQFFTSATLSDRQQRRLELVREFIGTNEFTALKSQNVLLAWADPIETPFNRSIEARRVGEAIVLIPVQIERPKAGTSFTVPASCVSYTRILDGMSMTITQDSDRPIDLHLRFQLPSAILPAKVSSARFTAKLSAPSREVVLRGGTGPNATEVSRVSSPLNPIRAEIKDPSMLGLDAEGGLHLHLSISDLLEPPSDPTGFKPFWKIEFLELEVSGETVATAP